MAAGPVPSSAVETESRLRAIEALVRDEVGTVHDGRLSQQSLDGQYAPYVGPIRSRNVWSIGDSLTAGNFTVSANYTDGLGQGGIQYSNRCWQTWALLLSHAKWTHAGVFATGGFTAAQILANHVPSVIAAGTPGDTVVVFAGTNGNVVDDVKTIHTTLRAAGFHTVGVLIPPSSASTVAAQESFNRELQEWCEARAIPVADVYGATVDRSDGTMDSTVDFGDGVHLSEAGAYAVGTVFADVLNAQYATPTTLVEHNGAFTGQLQTYPLATGAPNDGTHYSGLSLGTGTMTVAADSDFLGGSCYQVSGGSVQPSARLANVTLVEGHRMRLGLAVKHDPGTDGLFQLKFVNTSGSTATTLWAIGFQTGIASFPAGLGVLRFYSEFTVPPGLSIFTYRINSITGDTDTVLKMGEVCLQDLTAMGLA